MTEETIKTIRKHRRIASHQFEIMQIEHEIGHFNKPYNIWKIYGNDVGVRLGAMEEMLIQIPVRLPYNWTWV